jgi:predicted membrane protein
MPTTTIATTTATTSAAAEVQKLQTTYGPQAQALSNSAASAYFSHLLLFQIIGLLLTIFFIVFTIYIAIQTGWLRSRVDRIQDVILKSDVSMKRVRDSWASVERHFFAGDDNDLKMALIEADTAQKGKHGPASER